MESQLFKSLGSSQGNTCLCFLLFWFQYCLSLQKIKPLYTSLKRGGGGRTRHCTMHETLERAHTTFYAIAQRIKQDKELQKLNLQNNKIIINIVFVSTKFNMFMFILFVCLLVQFADICSFLLEICILHPLRLLKPRVLKKIQNLLRIPHLKPST